MSGPRVYSRVEASFLPLAQAIIQTKGVPLARPTNADESRQAAFDRCCRVRCVHLGLIHFTVEFGCCWAL